MPRIQPNSRVKYVGIVEAIETDIKERLLKPGDKLPAQRHIAEALDIDLTTVTRAINEAAKRGLVETQRGSGCFVAQTAFTHYNSMRLTEGKKLDLSMNNPPQPSVFKLEQEIAIALANLNQDSLSPLKQLSYQETAGNPDDRAAGMTWLSDKISGLDSDLVLIASGAHSALFSILSHLKRGGIKAIAAPDFSYPGLRSIADHLAIDIYGVEMDLNGIIPEHLEQVCQKHAVQALYVIPNIDNPTTTTIPEQNRVKIADIAKRYKLTIIEDDPYFSFLDKPMTSFYSLLAEQTWHIATLSKCISPALRVAYVVCPNTNEALALAEEMRISNIMAPPLMTAVAAYWIRTGQIAEITAAVKIENIKRQQLVSSIFANDDLWTHAAGPHFWLKLAKGHRALDFTERAERSGVSVVPSTAFVTARSRIQAVRVSLGVTTDYDSLETGLRLLSDLSTSRTRSKSII
jgi:DNA-binding transcriptional MocR family regulator